MWPTDRTFPSVYRGVSLAEDERKFVENWLLTMLPGTTTDDTRELIEPIYVADALSYLAGVLVVKAQDNGDKALAIEACQTAERATLVAPTEPIYVCEMARCLDLAGFNNGPEYFQRFLDMAAVNIGVAGYNKLFPERFQNAMETAKKRLGLL